MPEIDGSRAGPVGSGASPGTNGTSPVATVDLGSNSFLLIIGRESGGQLSRTGSRSRSFLVEDSPTARLRAHG